MENLISLSKLTRYQFVNENNELFKEKKNKFLFQIHLTGIVAEGEYYQG